MVGHFSSNKGLIILVLFFQNTLKYNVQCILQWKFYTKAISEIWYNFRLLFSSLSAVAISYVGLCSVWK